MPDILIATGNPKKIVEIQAIVEASDDPALAGLRFVSLKDIGCEVEEPVEDGETFEANAEIKAVYYAKAAGMPCLADDSGLEVDALDGRPGVYSARYCLLDLDQENEEERQHAEALQAGGRDLIDPANNRKLMDALGTYPATHRSARFVCALALGLPDQDSSPAITRGTFEGRILTPDELADPEKPEEGRGQNGFGYDPLFMVPDLGITGAEMDSASKNQRSHRGAAVREILPLLAEHLG